MKELVKEDDRANLAKFKADVMRLMDMKTVCVQFEYCTENLCPYTYILCLYPSQIREGLKIEEKEKETAVSKEKPGQTPLSSKSQNSDGPSTQDTEKKSSGIVDKIKTTFTWKRKKSHQPHRTDVSTKSEEKENEQNQSDAASGNVLGVPRSLSAAFIERVWTGQGCDVQYVKSIDFKAFCPYQ